MRNYTKAYYLKDLRKYSDLASIQRPGSDELPDEHVIYVRDDFKAVTTDEAVFEDDPKDTDFLVKDPTEGWQAFLERDLDPPFAIPDDLKFMYEEEPAPAG